ncbi:hypothetical protein JL720_17361 [Aureococcus anophagefferens]|nr:hypothetical protein JL720_17361 [Aureococcus anophagefferens]
MSASPTPLRTVYYSNPKEVFVSHGVLQPELATHKHLSHGNARKHRRGGVAAAKEPEGGHDAAQGGGLLRLPARRDAQRPAPARAVLSSGAISTPSTARSAPPGRGRTRTAKPEPSVAAAGAVEMFSDEWLDKEENGTLCDLLFRWLARDAEAPSLVSAGAAHHAHVKDDKPKGHHHHHKSAKNRGAPSPTDGKHHHHHHHHKHAPTEVERGHHGSFDPGMDTTFDMSGEHHHAGDDAAAYARFDLDEHFASKRERLAQLTNKCIPGGMTKKDGDAALAEPDDLEYYRGRAIVGATAHLAARSPENALSAKHVLAFVLNELVTFKKVNPTEAAEDAGPAPLDDPKGGRLAPAAGGRPVCARASTTGSRPPLRAFGGEDDVAESKSGGDTAGSTLA